MKILIIGSGGREHAIVWKIAQSPKVKKIYCAPGNPGISQLAENVPIEVTQLDRLVQFAKDMQIDLTFVGPEVPLIDGIVDIFQKNKLTIDDITVSDYVVIFGVMLGDEFTAKSIIKQNQTEFIEGTIKNVEKNGYYIEIITADQETIIVDIEKNTVQKMIDEKTVQIASAGFSNYTVGARIHTVITKSDVEENRGSAVRTLLVPQQLTE